MENRLKQLEYEYKEFKDAYIKNGKELVNLANAINILSETLEKHMLENEVYRIKREEEEKRDKAKIDPLLEWFGNMNFTKRTIMWILGFFASVGGLILMYKELFK